MPSENNREVFGGEMSDTCEFASLDEAKEASWMQKESVQSVVAQIVACRPKPHERGRCAITARRAHPTDVSSCSSLGDPANLSRLRSSPHDPEGAGSMGGRK
jgi:hypothetical protein